MANDRRRTLQRLIRHFIDKQRYIEFHQLVRLLERHLSAHAETVKHPLRSVGRSAGHEDPAIRFLTDTADRTRPASTRPLQLMPEPNGSPPVELISTFMSLFGTTGVLPQHYTKLILQRARAGDTSLRDYLDAFHQRLTELAYQVWERSRPEIAWERAQTTDTPDGESQEKEDQFSIMLKNLVGNRRSASNETRSSDSHISQARLYFSGMYSNVRRPVLSLESMLAEYFRIPIVVRQFHARSVLLQQEDQWRLAGRPLRRMAQTRLGQGLIVGRKIPIVQTRLLIQLGPLDYHQFRDFLPNGRKHSVFRKLVRSFVGLESELEVELQLDPRQTPQMRPGRQGEASRLGWNTWLGGTGDATKRQTRFVIRD